MTAFTLHIGVYVRFPIDNTDAESLAECRDFRIGQLVSADDSICTVRVYVAEHDPFQTSEIRIARRLVHRCGLLENTPFIEKNTTQAGTILAPCSDTFREDEPMNYYVRLSQQVCQVSETEIIVEAHAQAPDPAQQLQHFEIHPPIWRAKRDQLLESHIQLQSATFGMEELVGSRILLLPHQAETIARVLGDRVCRYILADEVGLGKTVEACVILKGLQRRNPALRTLILAPHTLTRQWQNELSSKFWLDFSIYSAEDRFGFDPRAPGIILSVEDLERHPRATDSLLQRHWDALIVDEAHRLHRHPTQYNATMRLSDALEHCLVLSATPIMRRGSEYLALLRLMNPKHYGAMTAEQFTQMLNMQGELRRRLAYVGHALNEQDFDSAEFHEEIDPLIKMLEIDPALPQLVADVEPTGSSSASLAAAKLVHSYLSENYRIESRVIRNRRVSLQEQISLPQRKLDESYAYYPTHEEREVLAELTDYASEVLKHDIAGMEFMRALHYAAASSPFALDSLLTLRTKWLAQSTTGTAQSYGPDLIKFPSSPTEDTRLDLLRRRIQVWREVTENALQAAAIGRPSPQASPHRLLQVLRAVHDICVVRQQKVLIFCRWPDTLSQIEQLLLRHHGHRRTAVFTASKTASELQEEVDRFQSEEACQIMLSDETGGEGRNFQVASAIVHVDIPWMPAQIEQRIGRVDRVGRSGEVVSIVPYARDTVEETLFTLWNTAFELFTHSMSGMEIVLETIQNTLFQSFAENPREGLAIHLGDMTQTAHELRETIEEERYAEETTEQLDRRKSLARILDEYGDGERLKTPVLRWAEIAGLTHHFKLGFATNTTLIVFRPADFNHKAMSSAKFINPPDMREALRRSRRQHKLELTGTFDRAVAVRREDVVFFAPGEPWTDALIFNALHTDRGRSTGLMRVVKDLTEDWEGVDCLYSIRVDPRPLYAIGGDPIHLFHARGYLDTPIYRVIVGFDGKVVSRSSRIGQHLQNHTLQAGDVPLNRRSGHDSPLRGLMERFTTDEWCERLRRVVEAAEAKVREEFSFTAELAEEAAGIFERKVIGMRAAHQWLQGVRTSQDIDEYEQITHQLIAGLTTPQIKLESIGYWWLRSSGDASP